MSGSAWGTSAYVINQNTNTMDPNSMSSDRAQAARMKTAEIMAALKKGEPGDADKLMGKQGAEGNKGTVSTGWLKRKLGGGSKKGNEEVIR